MDFPTDPIVRNTFTSFFEWWLDRQQSFLDQLLALSLPTHQDGEQRKNLVEQVLTHYLQYYQEKSKAAIDDVFLMYSAPWLSTFERTFLWVTGFKPSLFLKLINGSVGNDFLSVEQLERIEAVKVEIRREERGIDDIVARVQESVAAPPLFYLMTRAERRLDRGVSDLDTAMDKLKTSMVVVMEKADELRGETLRRVVEILSPVQTVKFLAGAAQFQLQTRRWGLDRDSQRAASGIDFI